MVKYFIILFFTSVLILRFITLDKAELSEGQNVDFTSRLMTEPTPKGHQQSFQLFYKGNRININTSSEKEYHYGEILRVNGSLTINLLKSRSRFITMKSPQIEAKEDKLAVLYNVRQLIISTFERNLSPNNSALLLGIVFGIKSNFSTNFLENLKLLGLMHVIAASGMNVTLTAGFLSAIFLIFFKRQTALVLTISGIIFYALLAGFQPSIVRAAIMGIIVFTAQILGRQRLSAYSLFITAYIMILFSPFVVWDIGFQLSFLATAGLIFLRPLFYEIGFLKKFFSFIVVGQDVSTTIAAQIATLPILLANFGLYSLSSVVINALVLWTVPIIMILGGVGFLLSIVFEPLGRVIIYLSVPLLVYFESIVNIFSGFSGAVNISISWPFVVSYYFLILSLLIAVYRNKASKTA
ncbi:MAG: ComEC/Rec2 family competence protein [Patescibacteria group bacterium]